MTNGKMTSIFAGYGEQPERVAVRGKKSGRTIEIGDDVIAPDGDFEVTVTTRRPQIHPLALVVSRRIV